MRVLTIAGSDPNAWAGIQADLEAFTHLGMAAATVVTAVTAQDSGEVYSVHAVPAAMVGRQIDAVLAPGGSPRRDIAAAKTGMLATKSIVEMVVRKIRQYGISTLVVDPVLAAHSGRRLLEEEALPSLKSRLLPLATVATPNIPEAEQLLGTTIGTLDEAQEAARAFCRLGCAWTLLKGSHLPVGDSPAGAGHLAIDLLSDGHDVWEFPVAQLDVDTHGSGCLLSASLTAALAQERPVPEAVGFAESFVSLILKIRARSDRWAKKPKSAGAAGIKKIEQRRRS